MAGRLLHARVRWIATPPALGVRSIHDDARVAARSPPPATWMRWHERCSRSGMRRALASLAASGGGVLHVARGVYRVAVDPKVGSPDDATILAAGYLPSNVKIVGDGVDVSTLRLAGGAPNGAALLTNLHVGGGDTNIGLRDLTIDGNAVAQRVGEQYGVRMWNMTGFTATRVKFKNVRGTAASGPGEGFHAELVHSAYALFDRCEVEGSRGRTASGFSATSPTT